MKTAIKYVLILVVFSASTAFCSYKCTKRYYYNDNIFNTMCEEYQMLRVYKQYQDHADKLIMELIMRDDTFWDTIGEGDLYDNYQTYRDSVELIKL